MNEKRNFYEMIEHDYISQIEEISLQ